MAQALSPPSACAQIQYQYISMVCPAPNNWIIGPLPSSFVAQVNCCNQSCIRTVIFHAYYICKSPLSPAHYPGLDLRLLLLTI